MTLAHPTVPYHVLIMITEFERRKKKNPRYSLRAYSAFLNVHPSAMCRLLKQKRTISVKAYAEIAQKLNLSDDEKRRFISSVAEEKAHLASQVLANALVH